MLAVRNLQQYLLEQQDWSHNFGLSENEGSVIGKMFGVLVVHTFEGEVGYLAAFSGKLAGSNHHPGFVPPIFDGMTPGGFLNDGMTALSRMSEEIRMLEQCDAQAVQDRIKILKARRRTHSMSLQNKIFDQYYFLNQAGCRKSLREIFENGAPPAGAGECAAPKLLQYAFQHGMRPLSMAEFWWGLSPKSATWKHGHFYPACREKCAPILAHMLDGMEIDKNPDLLF